MSRPPSARAAREAQADLARQIRLRLVAACEHAGNRSDHANWCARHRAEVEKVASWLASEHGARIRARGDCIFVRILDLEATATSGLDGALRNWCTAATRRAEAGKTRLDLGRAAA